MATDDIDFGYERIIQDLEKLGGKTVSVGVFADAGKADNDKTDLVDVAIWNEYGTKKIPKRPFLRKATDKNLKKWQKTTNNLVGMVIDGTFNPEEALDSLGNEAEGDVKEIFDQGSFTPNAPSTIAQKGSSKPLINHSRLRNSVHYKIEE